MDGKDTNIRLEGGGPWGFRLTGGKDFCSPLTVSKITPGGKASHNGVWQGDQIITINFEDCRNMSHMDAQDAIKKAGSTLDLSIKRGDGANHGREPLTMTENVNSQKVDHKYNAIPKPFGAPSYQAPKQTMSTAAQPAPTVRSGPPPTAPKPSSPMAPAYSHYTGGPPRSFTGGRDQIDSEAAMRAKKKEIEEEMLAQRFKLSISDDGEVNYDETNQVPNWGNPPDPNVQSKSFKMLQRHLQQHEDDDLPPPPPEAYDGDDGPQVQSQSFQMLKGAVDAGEAPPSAFSRDRGDRSKPSTTPMPSRPSVPINRSTGPDPPYASPMSRPGQPPPVALPGMARQEPSPHSSQPKIKTQRPQAPSYQHPPHQHASHSPAHQSPRGPPQGGGSQHQEIKRQPIKPPQPADGSRTPYCDACGQEIFGPFVSAIGRSWHPDHFTCAGCGDSLQNQGFIEEGGKLYCEKDYNQHFAPQCNSCKQPIVGPKSLHACVFPKPKPKSSAPVPSSDMLKAIREGQPTAKLPRKPKINPSLITNKRSMSDSNDFGKVHYPVHGIDYMARRDSNQSRSRTSSTSSDSGSVFRSRSESSTDQWEALVSPKTVKEFEKLHAEMSYVEPGSGSMKDKVKQLKKQVQIALQQEQDAKEAKAVAAQRYKKHKILAKELKWRIHDGEDKLQRLETKLENTRGRFHERSRIVEESLGNKKRAENMTKENIRDKQNIEYEITEVNAARDSAVTRLREVSRRLVKKQAAIQNVDDHIRSMNARSKMLTDMKDMYKLRINNIHSKSSRSSMKNEKQSHRIHILEDSFTQCIERFKRAEKLMLPLKIYMNQLQDAVAEENSNTRRLSYELAAYQQRLHVARNYTDL